MGHFKGLIVSGIAQSITHLAFVWLNHQGVDFNALFIAISIENFAGGMGSAALVAYLSILCNKKYSATQYALLSSAASLFNNTITIYGGTLVRKLGWDYFFIFTITASFHVPFKYKDAATPFQGVEIRERVREGRLVVGMLSGV